MLIKNIRLWDFAMIQWLSCIGHLTISFGLIDTIGQGRVIAGYSAVTGICPNSRDVFCKNAKPRDF